jgi:uncharacterized protein
MPSGRILKSFGFPALLSSGRHGGGERFCVALVSCLGEYAGMSVAELPIHIDREKIARFCRERGIHRLSLFGSVLRDDFDSRHSDVDVLAEFEPGVLRTVGFRYFGYGDELAAIIGRKVDFCSRLHPLIFDRIKDELLPIYEGA